jgi:hypothetical protein
MLNRVKRQVLRNVGWLMLNETKIYEMFNGKYLVDSRTKKQEIND